VLTYSQAASQRVRRRYFLTCSFRVHTNLGESQNTDP